jgi:hypothetical protein
MVGRGRECVTTAEPTCKQGPIHGRCLALLAPSGLQQILAAGGEVPAHRLEDLLAPVHVPQ